MDLLPPLEPPCPARSRTRAVTFKHPAYPGSGRDLLLLHAADGPAADGLDYDFALICCGIVTGNTWATGWVAAGAPEDGQYARVGRPADGVLRGSTYYYFVGDHAPTHRYPVVPSFHHWRFPHDALPDPWARVEVPGREGRQDLEVLARDVTCRISAHRGAREVAHLVPEAERRWFNHNGMRRYCLDPLSSMAINDGMNTLVLRRDLNLLFSHCRFVLAAKRDRRDAVRLVVHVLNPERADEIISLYHNRQAQALRGVSVELIFARLAWAVFASAGFPEFDGLSKVAVQLLDPETARIRVQDLDQDDICGRLTLFEPYHPARVDELSEEDSICDYVCDESDDYGGGDEMEVVE